MCWEASALLPSIRTTKKSLTGTYSINWVEHYKARGHVKINPVVQIGLRRLLPVDWGEFG
jgi:hypothetical protein